MKQHQIVGICVIITGLILAISSIYNVEIEINALQHPIFVIGIMIIGLILIRGDKK